MREVQRNMREWHNALKCSFCWIWDGHGETHYMVQIDSFVRNAVFAGLILELTK